MNLVTLVGRLAGDPEERSTKTGKTIASFRVAVDRSTKDENGDYKADFIPCTAWERTAEFILKYFHKGDGIALTGRLEGRTYQAKDGSTVNAWEVVVSNAEFPPSKRDQTPRAMKPAEKPVAVGYNQGGFETVNIDDGDLPF